MLHVTSVFPFYSKCLLNFRLFFRFIYLFLKYTPCRFLFLEEEEKTPIDINCSNKYIYGGETRRRREKVIDPSPLTNRRHFLSSFRLEIPWRAVHRKRLGLVTLVLITRPGPRSFVHAPHPRTKWWTSYILGFDTWQSRRELIFWISLSPLTEPPISPGNGVKTG